MILEDLLEVAEVEVAVSPADFRLRRVEEVRREGLELVVGEGALLQEA